MDKKRYMIYIYGKYISVALWEVNSIETGMQFEDFNVDYLQISKVQLQDLDQHEAPIPSTESSNILPGCVDSFMARRAFRLIHWSENSHHCL